MKKQVVDQTHNRKLQHESAMLLYSSQNENDSAFSDAVLATMRNDDVSFLLKRDSTIVNYGSFQV